MEDVFSMEIPESFWTMPPPVQPQVAGEGEGIDICGVAAGDGATDLSQSEWSFERLLEGNLVDSRMSGGSSGSMTQTNRAGEVGHEMVATSIVADPIEYNAMLKRKLEEDLAAISMWRASSSMHPEICHDSNTYVGGHLVHNTDIHVKLGTSSSSMEPSPSDDDNNMDGEVEILGFMMPDEEKVKKRKESNRESARRSRSRKAAHMKDLEDQVTHLRVQNSSLLRRLATINKKYNDATVDNRVLKADIETLRAKVKMVEDTLKRLTNSPPSNTVPNMLPMRNMPSTTVPNMPTMSNMSSNTNTVPNMTLMSNMTSVGSQSHIAFDASVPIPNDNTINYYTTATTNASDENNCMDKTTPLFQEEGTCNNTLNSMKIKQIDTHGTTDVEFLHSRVATDMQVAAEPVSWGPAPLSSNETFNKDVC